MLRRSVVAANTTSASSSSKAHYSASTSAMKSSEDLFQQILISHHLCPFRASDIPSQKTLSQYQPFKLWARHNNKKGSFISACNLNRNYAANHWLRSPSIKRLSTLKYPPFGFWKDKPFALLQRSKTHLPLEKPMGGGVINQSDSSSSTRTGEVKEVVLPTMYHCSSFLQVSSPEPLKEEVENGFALVILNHDLPLLTPFLWRKACCCICADGGANRIYDCIPSLLPHEDPIKVRERYKPDVIKGDLDSIRPEVKEFYARLGTKILDNSDDQDTTDLWKCLSYVRDSIPDIEKGNVKLLVLGALGGRLDHEFANFNSLFLFRKVRIILLSDESMAFLLPKNYKHEIMVNPSVEGPYCGLIPLSGPSLSTTTTGLKWDLDKSSLQFGGLISTSNMPVSDLVMVTSDTDLVWTISLQRLHAHLQELIGSRNR